MIEFKCAGCGRNIRVASEHAGKKGRCPDCHTVVTVPQPDLIPLEKPVPRPHDPDEDELAARCAIPHSKAKRAEDSPEYKSLRRFPWFIDILLYPFSISGVANLCIFWFVPILLSIIPAIGLIGLLLIIVRVIVAGYMYYYLLDCIRDSATGGVRAPENVGSQPGVSDAFDAIKQVIASFVVFWGPFFAWLLYVLWHNLNTKVGTISPTGSPVFWGTLSYAVLFFPAGVLAVAMMDFTDAIKPWIWARAIFSAFWEYMGLVIGCSALSALIYLTIMLSQTAAVLGLLARGVDICLLMILAHLIGRFYYRNSQKLGWDE